MRVATYRRISTDEQNQPTSLEVQSDRLASYIASQEGWELVRQFADSYSGATLERPGLQQALNMAKIGGFDLLLVYRVDRLARSVSGLAKIIEDLDSCGIAFRSATEPFDTSTPAGRMMVQMLGVFAEFERATIIDRVISGMEKTAARGAWCGGREPFGYRLMKGEGRLEVIEDEAALVQLIFGYYTKERLGAHAIATRLNEAGHRTKAGRQWGYKSILSILGNRTYLGEVHFRETWYPAPHPAVMDKSTFDKAASLRHERGENASKRASNGSSDYLMTGKVVCESCGFHCAGTRATGRSKTYRYYTCNSRIRYDAQTCSADRIPADALDRAVVEALLSLLDDSDLVVKAVAKSAQVTRSHRESRERELEVVNRDLAKVESSIERYLVAFEAGSLSGDLCGKRVEDLNAQALRLRERHGQLTEELECESSKVPIPSDLARLGVSVRKALECGPPGAVKALIGSLVHEVRVTGRNAIHPVFKVPTGIPGGEPGGDGGAVLMPTPSVEVTLHAHRAWDLYRSEVRASRACVMQPPGH